MTTEKFALRWNDFESNISKAFKDLRDDRELCDVTLACEDDQEVEAHKVILASCSPFFDRIFKRYKNSQPLLYMKGVTSHQLQSLMSFIYLGQVSLAQEELTSFLSVAEDLQVRGLSQRNPGVTEEVGREREEIKFTKKKFTEEQQVVSQEIVKPEVFAEEEDTVHVYEDEEYVDGFNVSTAVGSTEMGWDHDATNKDLFESLTESYLTSVLDSAKGKLWTCRECGKQVKNKPNLQHHIEANHIEEQSNRYNCQFCDTRKSTYKALMKHLYKDHRGIVMQRVN